MPKKTNAPPVDHFAISGDDPEHIHYRANARLALLMRLCVAEESSELRCDETIQDASCLAIEDLLRDVQHDLGELKDLVLFYRKEAK